MLVFHAGTRLENNGIIYTNGGRVLTVTGMGKDMVEAREKVYGKIPNIYFEGCYYRKDIALREVA
jgi:phosphoribosylamine--glycine ligase